MDTVLPPDLVKSANPGIDDFGSGNIIALTSQCLRTAKLPSPCEICLTGCAVGALVANADARPNATTDCLRCGLCIALCPSQALAATTRTVQQIARLLLQATLRVDELTIACERSLALFRLEAASDEPEEAEQTLKILNKAVETENLFKVPCLAMMTRELWFVALNEIGVARLKALNVYLPLGQCEACPANCDTLVEDMIGHAIDSAERWSGQIVTPIYEPEDIPQYHKPTIRNYVTVSQNVGRREAFTGFFSGFKEVLDETNRVGNRAVDETLKQRDRKDTLNRTRLALGLQAQVSGFAKPIISPLRYMLVESVGRNPSNAQTVEFAISQTDDAACTRCGDCLKACSIHARSFVPLAEGEDEGEGAAAGAGEGSAAAGAAAGAGEGAAAGATATNTSSPNPSNPGPAKMGFLWAANAAGRVDPNALVDPLTGATACPPGTADNAASPSGAADLPAADKHIMVDPLYCLGCSACVQACPAQACSLTTATGSVFLLPGWDDPIEPEDEYEDDGEGAGELDGEGGE